MMTRLAVISLLLFVSISLYAGGKWVVINGQRLNAQQIAQMERNLGTTIAPGNYIYNALNGCWANLSNGTSGCLSAGGGGTGAYANRRGSGERYSNGSWIHRSEIGGYSVGGTGDGCYYTPNWSNC